MYSKFAHLIEGARYKETGKIIKPYHHVKLDDEFRMDCQVWIQFLVNPQAVARPFVDLDSANLVAEDVGFLTDASLNKKLGFGCVFKEFWDLGTRVYC